MSGEQDIRPTPAEQIKALRDRLNELERRVSGDDIPLDLSDINDVRVDSLGDATITLANGSALVYRAADELWVPGTASAGFPITLDDATNTYTVDAGTGNLFARIVRDSDSHVLASVLLDEDGDLITRGDRDLVETFDRDAIFNIGNDALIFPTRDFGVSTGRHISMGASGGVTIDTGSSDMELRATTANISLEATGGHIKIEGVNLFVQVTAPADADVATSSVSLWLDDTPGATALKIKAKDSGGTVRTGTVALA